MYLLSLKSLALGLSSACSDDANIILFAEDCIKNLSRPVEHYSSSPANFPSRLGLALG